MLLRKQVVQLAKVWQGEKLIVSKLNNRNCNSEPAKYCSTISEIKLISTNTATIVRLIAITAKPMASLASKTTLYGILPYIRYRSIFSISTIASSTKIPATSVRENKLNTI